MNRILRTGFVSALVLTGICQFSGCGQSSPTGTAAANSSAGAAASPSTDAIARAASDFLDAVLKGDTQRASARLTPQAMQRIIASGKQFAPPGLETATFRIGEVRAPSQGQAVVQCVLTDTASGSDARSEEMCCLMRYVENDWRVSGIAYGTGPNQPWTLSDFETGQNMALPRRPAVQNAAGAASPPSAGRPSPPRTAQEQLPSAIR